MLSPKPQPTSSTRDPHALRELQALPIRKRRPQQCRAFGGIGQILRVVRTACLAFLFSSSCSLLPVKRLTLSQFFVLAAFAIAGVVATGFWLFIRSTRADIERRAALEQVEAAAEVRAKVMAELDHAKRVLEP